MLPPPSSPPLGTAHLPCLDRLLTFGGVICVHFVILILCRCCALRKGRVLPACYDTLVVLSGAKPILSHSRAHEHATQALPAKFTFIFLAVFSPLYTSQPDPLPTPPFSTPFPSPRNYADSITSLVNSNAEYLADSLTNQKKWSRLLRLNETKRRQLEESLEALAMDHRRLEREAKRSMKRPSAAGARGSSAGGYSSGSGQEEFFDAESQEGEGDDIFAAIPEGGGEDDMAAAAKTAGDSLSIGSTAATTTAAAATAVPVQGGGRAAEETTNAAVATAPEMAPAAVVSWRARRRIPDRPKKKMSLWSVMKSCIGKDLSKIPMPVHFNEPVSFTQRLVEDCEYADLLGKAAAEGDPHRRMAFVAAFTVSSFANVIRRTNKPFNPLLGETFEFDRRATLGYRCIVEQVSRAGTQQAAVHTTVGHLTLLHPMKPTLDLCAVSHYHRHRNRRANARPSAPHACARTPPPPPPKHALHARTRAYPIPPHCATGQPPPAHCRAARGVGRLGVLAGVFHDKQVSR